MPYKTLAPLRKEFRLIKTDETYSVPDKEMTLVTIKQARVRENDERRVMWNEWKQVVMKSGELQNIYVVDLYDLMAREVYLTLVDCNITDDTGNPFFRIKKKKDETYLDMTFDEFKRAWGLLEEDVALEIHDKVVEVNPHWKFKGADDLGEA